MMFSFLCIRDTTHNVLDEKKSGDGTNGTSARFVGMKRQNRACVPAEEAFFSMNANESFFTGKTFRSNMRTG
jgi:hypothetical protein